MYGGHITDPWDRRTNNVYLEVNSSGVVGDYATIVQQYSSTTSFDSGACTLRVFASVRAFSVSNRVCLGNPSL